MFELLDDLLSVLEELEGFFSDEEEDDELDGLELELLADPEEELVAVGNTVSAFGLSSCETS
jgi:hypothetical protein